MELSPFLPLQHCVLSQKFMSVNCPLVAAQGYVICCDLGTSSHRIVWNPQCIMKMIQIYNTFQFKTFCYFCCIFIDLLYLFSNSTLQSYYIWVCLNYVSSAIYLHIFNTEYNIKLSVCLWCYNTIANYQSHLLYGVFVL